MPDPKLDLSRVSREALEALARDVLDNAEWGSSTVSRIRAEAAATLCYEGDCAKMTGRARPCPVHDAQPPRAELTDSDRAYTERNRLVAALARHYPSGLKPTAIEGWDPAWNGCCFIDTPEGQMSWHYHDSDAHLFAGLPPYDKPWDGHTTPEKYERLSRLRPRAELTGEERAVLEQIQIMVYRWADLPPVDVDARARVTMDRIYGLFARKEPKP